MEGPNINRKVDSSLRRAFRRFTEPLVLERRSSAGATQNEDFEGLVLFEDIRREPFALSPTADYDLEIRVDGSELPVGIDTSSSSTTTDAIYIPRMDDTFIVDAIRERQLFTVLECNPEEV
jgi:hypothetical protein